MAKYFSIITAISSERGIGKNNKLPWTGTPENKEDIERFKYITTHNEHNLYNIVIMGRKTYESLRKPLPNRINVIISRSYDKNKSSILTYSSFDDALDDLYSKYDTTRQKIFVIGGECLYKPAICRRDCKYIYMTRINCSYPNCDTFFPDIPRSFSLIEKNNGKNPNLTYLKYENISDINGEEYQYLNLMANILRYGILKPNRTKVQAYSVFGDQIRFDLSGGILPLITTKKMFYRGIVEELLFFIRGDHDNRKLQSKNIHIWDGNTSRDYLDKYNKKHIETNDLGLAYGVQWRAAGAELGTIDTDYKGKGIDQLNEAIKILKTEQNSRRIIINAWNPEYLNDMALVPCHVMYQFYVSNNKLSCMMTQRSADIFLGLPFNIASTATLVHILSKVCKLDPGEVIINLGDAHIYENHVKQVKLQLKRTPYLFPRLSILKELNDITDMESLEWKDFKLTNYYCHNKIKGNMVV